MFFDSHYFIDEPRFYAVIFRFINKILIMPKLTKVKILICDTSHGNDVQRALYGILGTTVSIEIAQNGGLHIQSSVYDVVFISGQDFLVKNNTIKNFRKELCAPDHTMVIMSSSVHHLSLCNSPSVLCIDRKKLLKVSDFPEMKDFLIKIANRESVKKHDALWKGPPVEPITFWKRDSPTLRHRRKMRRIVMVVVAFCIINLFFLGAFPDEYIAFLLFIFHFVKGIV